MCNVRGTVAAFARETACIGAGTNLIEVSAFGGSSTFRGSIGLTVQGLQGYLARENTLPPRTVQ